MKLLKGLALALLAGIVLLALFAFLALRDRPSRDVVGERRSAQGAAGSLVYYVHGEGPLLVLLPSFARSASDFNELAGVLERRGYRTLAMQPRGIGGSALGSLNVTLHDFALDIVSVLEAERITTSVFVVGHAFGNRVARTFASDYPDRVRALVLLGAGGEVPPPPEISRAIATGLFGFWSETARREAIGKAFFSPGHAVPDDWIRGWYPLASIVQRGATAATPFAHWGSGGNSPMLVLQARDDRPAPRDLAYRLVGLYPQRVTWREIPNAGHALLPEQPDAVASEITAFLKGR